MSASDRRDYPVRHKVRGFSSRQATEPWTKALRLAGDKQQVLSRSRPAQMMRPSREAAQQRRTGGTARLGIARFMAGMWMLLDYLGAAYDEIHAAGGS